MTDGNQGYGQQPGQYGQGPSYASPQYGPGSYGQPAGGSAGARSRRRVGVVGLVLTVIGAVGIALACTVLKWFSSDSGNPTDTGSDSAFSKVHDQLAMIKLLTNGQAEARFVAVQYFSWLAWVLLAVVVLAAIFANLPIAASGAFRVIGPILALAAIGLTFAAIDLIDITGSGAAAERTRDALSYTEYLKHAGLAFYAAAAGFLLAGIGALIGSRRA